MTSPGRDDLFDRYAKQVGEAFCEISAEFRASPESFLYEADVQGRLFANLFGRLAKFPSTGMRPDDHWRAVLGERTLAINPVKAEYPDSVRFDIALLHGNLDEKENVWNQPPRVAIEIKLRQANGGGQSFHEDRGKLNGHLELAGPTKQDFTGVCVVFCHSLSDEDRLSWEAQGCAVDPEAFTLPRNGIACLAVTAARR